MKRMTYVFVAIAAIVGLLAVSVQAPVGERHDPLPSYTFRVEIDGIASASFREVSGLRCETEVVEFREGGESSTIRLLPGLSRCGPITLKRGFTGDAELWNWYNQVFEGSPVRKNGSVIILDNSGTERARYNFFDAWPVSYSIGEFDAGSKGVLVETVEIAVERIVYAP